jgi:hypothetical protein
MRALPVFLGSIAIAAVLGAAAARAGAAAEQPSARHVVVAELFTSEGCSSCPPADALLQRIAAQSPVPGVEILGLEEHVDYWDNLGWRDPFSSAAFTRRQNDYESRVFHLGEIYTPQLVVDGAFASIGSDAGNVRASILKAAARPAAAVRVTAQAIDGRAHVVVGVDAAAVAERRKDAEIVAVLVEDGLTTNVERGENRGRTLQHFAVVRSLTAIGTLTASASTGAATADLPLAREWQPSRLRVVAFVQDRQSRRILGSSAAALAGGVSDARPHQQPTLAASTPPREERSRHHIEVKTSVSSKTVAPGQMVALLLDVRPTAGVHVYAPGAAGYKPIALHLDPQPGLVAGDVHFPASEDLYLAALNEHVPVYQKVFHVTQPVMVERAPAAVHAFAKDSEVTVSGRLDYQACTDTVCFPPQSMRVSWTVAVR